MSPPLILLRLITRCVRVLMCMRQSCTIAPRIPQLPRGQYRPPPRVEITMPFPWHSKEIKAFVQSRGTCDMVLFHRIVNRRRRKKRGELLNWTRIGHAPGLDPYEGEERGHVDSLSLPLSLSPLSFPFPFRHQSSLSRLFIEFASVRLLLSPTPEREPLLPWDIFSGAGLCFHAYTLQICLVVQR